MGLLLGELSVGPSTRSLSPADKLCLTGYSNGSGSSLPTSASSGPNPAMAVNLSTASAVAAASNALCSLIEFSEQRFMPSIRTPPSNHVLIPPTTAASSNRSNGTTAALSSNVNSLIVSGQKRKHSGSIPMDSISHAQRGGTTTSLAKLSNSLADHGTANQPVSALTSSRKNSDRKSIVSSGAAQSKRHGGIKSSDESNKQRRPDSACSSTGEDPPCEPSDAMYGCSSPGISSLPSPYSGANSYQTSIIGTSPISTANQNELKFSVKSILAADEQKVDNKFFEKRKFCLFILPKIAYSV